MEPAINPTAEDITKCVMQESMGFGLGIIAGTAMALRTKKFYHFMALTTVGTGFDMMYARGIKCRPLIEAYQAVKDAKEADVKRGTQG